MDDDDFWKLPKNNYTKKTITLLLFSISLCILLKLLHRCSYIAVLALALQVKALLTSLNCTHCENTAALHAVQF